MEINSHYKKLRVLLVQLTGSKSLDDLIAEALTRAGKQISKSRLHGWRASPENKSYRAMSDDDLLDVMDALIKYFDHHKCKKCGHIETQEWTDEKTCQKCKLD